MLSVGRVTKNIIFNISEINSTYFIVLLYIRISDEVIKLRGDEV